MSIIVSFDPGETTGIAVVQRSSRAKVAAVRYAFERDAVGLKDYLVKLQHGAVAGWMIFSDLLIVCERFRLYPWMGKAKSWSPLPEVLAQGAIEYVAYALGLELNYQSASAMKQLFPDSASSVRDELKAHNVPAHARDAVCHALYAIVRRNKLGGIPQLVWDGYKEVR